MITRDQVNLWWINKNTQPDPRGKSPGLFYFYNYTKQDWVSILN